MGTVPLTGGEETLLTPGDFDVEHVILGRDFAGVIYSSNDPKQDPLDIDLAALPKNAVVADIVYNPLETPLLAAARARGNRVVDGLGMLLHQAAPGFEHWFGVRPEVTAALRAHVAASLGAA